MENLKTMVTFQSKLCLVLLSVTFEMQPSQTCSSFDYTIMIFWRALLFINFCRRRAVIIKARFSVSFLCVEFKRLEVSFIGQLAIAMICDILVLS